MDFSEFNQLKIDIKIGKNQILRPFYKKKFKVL
jgi:hypothetical protein